MAFWRCYYPVIWATKHREPIITPEIERHILTAIETKSIALECPILAVNGTADHIHVAVCIPPKVAAAEWVRNVKGASAREVNTMFTNLDAHFRWQDSYGILTFGAKHLETVTNYIARQKEHHAANTTIAYLEQIDD
jgi:putative transposase